MVYAILLIGVITVVFLAIGTEEPGTFRRKMMTALFTSALSVLVLNLLDPVSSVDGGWMMGVIVYSLYIVPIMFIYGIITSVVSEKLSSKATSYRGGASLLLHMLFGFAFLLPYSLLFESLHFLSRSLVDIVIDPLTGVFVLFAVAFFFIDYLLKVRERKIIYLKINIQYL